MTRRNFGGQIYRRVRPPLAEPCRRPGRRPSALPAAKAEARDARAAAEARPGVERRTAAEQAGVEEDLESHYEGNDYNFLLNER